MKASNHHAYVYALPTLLALMTGAAVFACGPTSAQSTDGGVTSDASSNADGASDNDATTGDGGTSDGGSKLRNEKFRDVALGARTTCAVYNDGRLFCFGGNDSGQLGDGTTTDRGGEAGSMATLQAVDLGAGVKVTQVALGDSHVCALLATGAVKCWGSAEQGQLGLEDNQSRGKQPGQMGSALPELKLGNGRTALKLAAGVDFTCALLDDKSVKCWGRNGSGQLGQGSNAVYVGRSPGDMGDALPKVDLGAGRTVKDIVAGQAHACALLDDDTVKCWGNNQFGQLALGDTDARGRKASDMGANLPAASIGTGRKAKHIFAGGNHSCAVLDDATVRCWGANAGGNLGTETELGYGTTPANIGDAIPKATFGQGRSVVEMALGLGFSCAKLDDGKLKCFGDNDDGQLCQGDKLQRGSSTGSMGDALPYAKLGSGRTLDFAAAGPQHACGVFSDKSLRCWGINGAGQLGLGDRNPRGGAPGDVGDTLAAAPLP